MKDNKMILTPQRELFIDNIIKGKSQRESYKTAYPICIRNKWKENAIDTQASILMANRKVIERLEEKRKPIVEKIAEKIRYSIEDSYKECDLIYNLAIIPNPKTGSLDLPSALRAIDLKQKLFGLQINKSTIDVNVSIHNQLQSFKSRLETARLLNNDDNETIEGEID